MSEPERSRPRAEERGRVPRSPLRVALTTFLALLVGGLLFGFLMVFVVNPGGDHFERGRRLGQGLAQLSVIGAVVAYLVQRARTRR